MIEISDWIKIKKNLTQDTCSCDGGESEVNNVKKLDSKTHKLKRKLRTFVFRYINTKCTPLTILRNYLKNVKVENK